MSSPSRRRFVGGVGAAVLLGGAAGRPAKAHDDGSGHAKEIVPGSPSPAYSRAVKGPGGLVFVAGVVGAKPGGGMVTGEFEAEARQALDNLKASVVDAGSSLDKVLKCTVFLTDVGDFATFNRVYVELFPKDPPARSTVVVKELVVPGARVEVDCFAFV